MSITAQVINCNPREVIQNSCNVIVSCDSCNFHTQNPTGITLGHSYYPWHYYGHLLE